MVEEIFEVLDDSHHGNALDGKEVKTRSHVIKREVFPMK
jgi:hypothetical protein